MSAEKYRLTLKIRKQAVLVESELNRVHLVDEWQELRGEIHQATARVFAAGSAASTAAKVAASIAGYCRGFSRGGARAENKKSSWVSAAFKGVRAGVSILSFLRSRKR